MSERRLSVVAIKHWSTCAPMPDPRSFIDAEDLIVISDFVSSTQGRLAERWAAVILTPAFVFWTLGLLAWVIEQGWSAGWAELGRWMSARSNPEQLALLSGGLLVLNASGVLVARLATPLTRALEGYGWPRSLRARAVEVRRRRIGRDEQLLQEIAKELAKGRLARTAQYATLDSRLHRVPPDPVDRMPTDFGDLLRRAERMPYHKYGLDPVKCWTAFWLVLPEEVQAQLNEARGELDRAVTAVAWALISCVWLVWAWWVLPLGLLASVAIYLGWVRYGAESYARSLESAFDLYRWRLYEALRLPLPTSPAIEPALGEALTDYLWRGSDRSAPEFLNAQQNSDEKA